MAPSIGANVAYVIFRFTEADPPSEAPFFFDPAARRG